MQVVSTNLGTKKAIFWKGKEIFTGIYKYPVNQRIELGLTDVENDDVMDRRYHGGVDKACYLYSADHYKYWKHKIPKPDWQYGMFGENITIEGLNEAEIHIGDIYKLGSALVQITQPRQPCFKLGIRLENPDAVKMFVAAEKPGAYIRVLEKGLVNAGDKMELIDAKTNNFSLAEIFHLIYNAPKNIEKIRKAIEIPELAESCRNDLIKLSKLFGK